MSRITLIVVGLLLIVSCIGLVSVVGPAAQTEAETRQIGAQVELIESETSQESQRTLSNTIDVLLTELRLEREHSDRIQREQFQLLIELTEKLRRPNYTWLWVILVGIGGIVSVLLLRPQERVVVVMLSPDVSIPWLPVGSTDIVPRSGIGTTHVVDVNQDKQQEIVIE